MTDQLTELEALRQACELDTINRLYLELSQFATARTPREIVFAQRQLDAEKTLANHTEVLKECEDFTRSVLAITKRSGEETHWGVFVLKVENTLRSIQGALNWTFAVKGGDTCTAKTFRTPVQDAEPTTAEPKATAEREAEQGAHISRLGPTDARLHEIAVATVSEISNLRTNPTGKTYYDIVLAALKSVNQP